jgi:glyoxylase-like metal-dependent hydrolase (beta-lactamase superfamily II)
VTQFPLLDSDVQLGTGPGRVVALLGSLNGKYPSGNSVLVSGTEESILIDPSLAVADRGGVPGPVDRMLVSHAHEDHIAGCSTFPGAHVHAHHDDLLGLHSLDGMLAVYGFEPSVAEAWAQKLVSDFHYQPRVDATGFADGQRFDLGGKLTVSIVHLPGHTRGHCGFMIEPDGVLFVADIDLTGFGPYYGDHWSDLEDFERSIDRVATIDAKHYVTFHHKGIVSTRTEFLEQLSTFKGVIQNRDLRLLAFLQEPRSLDDIVNESFIYRPSSAPNFAAAVERRSMSMHLERMLRIGTAAQVEPGTYRATG